MQMLHQLSPLAAAFMGGAASVLLVGYVGRYLGALFAPLENKAVIGFCLAAGLVLGRGAVIDAAPSSEDIQLLGRAFGSLLALAALWLAWFRRGARAGT